MVQQSPMTIKKFHETFLTEKDCLDHLVKIRFPDGFVCPNCGHTHHSFIKTRFLFQCANCKKQTSPTAGSVMHKSRVPLKTWFEVILSMANDKRGVFGYFHC